MFTKSQRDRKFGLLGEYIVNDDVETMQANAFQNCKNLVEVKFEDVSDLLGLHAIKRTFQAEVDITETKFVQNSMRSGQKEEYAGSIVICGDVNAGAEIIAGGNIIVLGTLRGLAHAGAKGNKKAIIAKASETKKVVVIISPVVLLFSLPPEIAGTATAESP